MKKWLVIVSLGLTGAAATAAQPAREPQRSTVSGADTLKTDLNALRHMTYPVSVGGGGTYGFTIDTAAERTVISRELADTLQLPAGGQVLLTSMADVRQVPTAIVPGLLVGRQQVGRIQAPALAQTNLGAHGMLGVDSLDDQRVTFDFERNSISIEPSRADPVSWPSNTIVVRGQTRLGRLVLADATVGGQRVWAVMDTGSPITIGNSKLQERLMGDRRVERPPHD
jgi:hypothetical protein